MIGDGELVDGVLGCAVADVTGGGMQPCERDAVLEALLSCTHGHMEQTPLCMFHVREVADGWVRCPVCEVAPGGGHRCRLEVLADVDRPGGDPWGNVRILVRPAAGRTGRVRRLPR
ncbi:hypothetical protein GCM10010466_39690 [Planomonospora alba]|uniref:Uncharacterized protein n=1 Tax=Planomonospora alba TaxID=161354 RepID=A0ABP6NDH0_9ACTN